ncbi:translation initiation factor IF-2 [Winogradskyella immobilis]|uniref:Translation initiation factor IF-2 n=1 Tax=Winogradskyella immobilis TaxID=2816852 RepID=A0ABS8EIG2_9FLAO|nr:translation initiation factor IF-2 [Winogradskyella immobilis]MCC1482986.1 translation initiation factor IF-2 [Winogradskyella immobilis]MCG0015081.1 translation initiation factor IF-2 [Winogradskyella immobilis]
MAQTRLNKVLRELNISIDRAVDFLESKGIEIEKSPNTKISQEVYDTLSDEFQTDATKREKAQEVSEAKLKEKEALREKRERELEEKEREEKAKEEARETVLKAKAELSGPKQVGKIDLEGSKPKKEEAPKQPEKTPKVEDKPKVAAKKEAPKASKTAEKKEETPKAETPKAESKTEKPKPKAKKEETEEKANTTNEPVDEKIKTQYQRLSGPKNTGQKIDLTQFNKPKKKKEDKKPAANADANKRKRRRISKPGDPGTKPNFSNDRRKGGFKKGGQANRPKVVKEEPSEEDVQKQIRETLEKLQGKSNKGKGAKYRREKRDQHRQQTEIDQEIAAAESKTIKVTEFVTVSEIATMMSVGVTEVISACMSLGMMVTMNQRLDAETLTIVAEEFGYGVEFITADIEESIEEIVDDPKDLKPRAPIVTVMGHVDHGKTSLLDYIREENVIAGESGGITQHIGAYGVELENGQKIAFLDTPGHEAFTAMRARGAQVTDIAIIVAAADDDIMPQTKEAISHAQAAGVPIVFAINKIDKPDANPEKIKEGLAAMNLLVEDWGGKIQSHDISAKMGTGVKELLEKVLLEAELLELKANPNKLANGTVVEAFLDKGRGYVSTILVQAGTLRIGDYVLAGKNSGKIKAMHDERGNEIKEAGPSTPVSILGLDGAPQAGDKFNVFEDEREAKQIATKRTQLQREQSVRTQRHITLDEIGRRIALGDFQELNIILKGDVDGSVEALTDSFQKLSTEEIQVNIIHKGVGAITESDVLLATASDAIIIGFNVRPMGNARQIADKEEIDIRTYSIIYDAINDLKDAMEGMLSPELKEEITGNAEIREIFKVSKVGSIAGCMVTNGKIYRNSGIRLIRDGVVIYTGELTSLKRFKDDVKEVSKGYDCGMQIKNYNDIKENDVIEAFQEVEVKKKLK